MKKFLVMATIVAGLSAVGCSKTAESTVATTTPVAITTDSGIIVEVTTVSATTAKAITSESAVQ
jgi:hypothetical protein